MKDQQGASVYESVVSFNAGRVGAAAVYCSDGRFGEQFDDFLHNALQLPRYDRVAVPGGPACLAEHFETYREGDTVAAQLEFLVAAHELSRVVLIAHEGCAFYTERLRMSSLAIPERQREDLAKAAHRVKQLPGDVIVDTFIAIVNNARITFERVVV